MGSGLSLGIESSCDETAAAVVERGAWTRSSVVASQVTTHAAYGGVVPELASREHLRNVVPMTRAALEQAGCGLGDLDAIAVTSGPGLAGALLVGMTYAKALAFARGIPLIAVNHLEGHIHAVLLQNRELEWQRSHPSQKDNYLARVGHPDMVGPPDALVEGDSLPMPALALVVSGGHTHLFLARPPVIGAEVGNWRYTLVGRTLDDAAGEAFDKVAKLLGLGYPVVRSTAWRSMAIRRSRVWVCSDQEQGASGREIAADKRRGDGSNRRSGPAFSFLLFWDQDGGAAVCGSEWDASQFCGAAAGADGAAESELAGCAGFVRQADAGSDRELSARGGGGFAAQDVCRGGGGRRGFCAGVTAA